MQYAKILGTGSYLPANRISNDDLAQKVDTSDEWITTRTGIKFRHIADENEKTSDLAAESARRALAAAGISADEIDLIIVATATPDMQFPSTATIVQHKLGMTNGCPAFDVQAVCAGFMYALNTADAYVKSGMAKKVLVIGAETFSRILDWSDGTGRSRRTRHHPRQIAGGRQLSRPAQCSRPNCQRPNLRYAVH